MKSKAATNSHDASSPTPATATHNFLERKLIPAYDFDAKEMVIIVVGSDQQEIETHLQGLGESDSSEKEQSPTEHTSANQGNKIEDEDISSQQDSSDDESADVSPRASEASMKIKVVVNGVEKGATATLFVGNLSWNIDDEWLAREFEEFGKLQDARVITDRDSGRSKGFGYVDFTNADSATRAFEGRNGYELDGRDLRVDFSLPRNNTASIAQQKQNAHAIKREEKSGPAQQDDSAQGKSSTKDGGSTKQGSPVKQSNEAKRDCSALQDITGTQDSSSHRTMIAHASYLTRNSPFFATELKKEMSEGHVPTIKLPNHSPKLVAYYLDFIYDKKLPTQVYKDTLFGANSPDSSAYELLAELYVFGEHVLDAPFRNAVTQEIVRLLHVMFHTTKVVNIIYQGTTEGSPVRRLLVDHALRFGRPGEHARDLDPAFTFDFMQAFLAAVESPMGIQSQKRGLKLEAANYFV